MSNQTIYSALVRAGMTAEGACAVMGNMMAESGMRSTNVEDRSGIRDEDYTARVDNDPSYDFGSDNGHHYGYGLCQWTLPSRKRALLAFAKSNGASIGDEYTQIQFCVKELIADFPGVWALLVSSHNLYECTSLFCAVYENPDVKNTDVRYGFAQEFLKEFGDQEVQVDVPEQKEDWKIAMIQFVMQWDGYWGKIDGQKSKDFFVCLDKYVEDMKMC